MKKYLLIPAMFGLMIGFAQADESWLPTLKTDTPEQGFQLAIKLSRMGVKTAQPNMDVLKKGRAEYFPGYLDLLRQKTMLLTLFFRRRSLPPSQHFLLRPISMDCS